MLMFIPYELENVFTLYTKSVVWGDPPFLLSDYFIKKVPTVLGGTGGFINIVHSQI